MDEIVWDDEPQLQAPEPIAAPLIEEQGITWDDAAAPIVESAPIETPLEVAPTELIAPVETIQPSIQADAQPEEASLFEQFQSFISQGDASREKAQSMSREEKDEYIKSSLKKTSSLYQTGQELAKSKSDISTAIDVKSKLDNIEARTSDISKTLKSFVGDEKSITELKTKQNDLNNEVVLILDGKGIEAFNDNGKLMIVTKDKDGNEVLKSLDEETFSQIMSDLGSAGGEIGGAITGAITGAGITTKKLRLSTSLAKRGVATATSGLIGGYLGAASGRMTDVIRNSLVLNREIDAKAMLEKGLESGALDVYEGGAGAVAGKIEGKGGDAVTGVKRYILDGNISGAKKILKSDYNLSDKQIDTMFTNLSKDLEGLDDLQGDKLLRAKLTSAMQQTPQGKPMIAKAIESNPKAAIQLSKEIDARAKFVEKAADSLTQKPSAIKKSLFAYQKLVKRNYGEVRKLISKALPTEKYQLDKDSFKATLSDINTRVIDPLVKDKLDNLITVLGQKTEGSIDGLIDLRQLFNKFYSKNKSAFELAPDKKALMEIQKTLDTKIDEVIDTLPSDVATGLKNAFKDAKSKYKEMYSVEDNVAFKQIMKKGASDEDIAKSLIKFSKSSDQTLEQVFSKLNPRKRRSAEFSILKEMVKKANIKGETKAIDFNKLLTNIGTSKQSFKTPEAQQFIKNIESYEAKFGKDAELQRIASGIAPKVEKSIATTLTGKIIMKISSMRFEALQRLLPTDNAKRLALQEAISKSLETARTPKELLFKMSKDTSIPSKERQLLKESIKKIAEIESKIQKDIQSSNKFQKETEAMELQKSIEDAAPAKKGFQAKEMTVKNEVVKKTDFDLIQAYQKNRKWNRVHPTKKRLIPQKQKDAYDKHTNIVDDIFDMDFKQDRNEYGF